jgi:hypothetical protein
MDFVGTVNSIACFALLAVLLPAAHVAHRWRHRLIIIVMAVSLALQMIDPVAEWLPDIAWPGALLNVAMAIMIAVWREDVWLLVRIKLNGRGDKLCKCSEKIAGPDSSDAAHAH